MGGSTLTVDSSPGPRVRISIGKGKQIESPIPGHPVSDATALMLEKALEALSRQGKKEI
jgi:hypothetical protein